MGDGLYTIPELSKGYYYGYPSTFRRLSPTAYLHLALYGCVMLHECEAVERRGGRLQAAHATM